MLTEVRQFSYQSQESTCGHKSLSVDVVRTEAALKGPCGPDRLGFSGEGSEGGKPVLCIPGGQVDTRERSWHKRKNCVGWGLDKECIRQSGSLDAAMEKSFKVPTNVPHKENKRAFELFQRKKRHSVVKRDVLPVGLIITICSFSYHPSSPPPLSPTVDRILEDRRGCGVRQTTVPFLNPGSEHRLDMS